MGQWGERNIDPENHPESDFFSENASKRDYSSMDAGWIREVHVAFETAWVMLSLEVNETL